MAQRRILVCATAVTFAGFVVAALWIAVGVGVGLAEACTPADTTNATRLNGREFVLAWRAEPMAIPVAEFFRLHVSACARSGARVGGLRMDAAMPAHGHGMNYRASVEALGNGQFIVRGLLLHMPGRWELVFDINTDDARETLRAAVDLK